MHTSRRAFVQRTAFSLEKEPARSSISISVKLGLSLLQTNCEKRSNSRRMGQVNVLDPSRELSEIGSLLPVGPPSGFIFTCFHDDQGKYSISIIKVRCGSSVLGYRYH